MPAPMQPTEPLFHLTIDSRFENIELVQVVLEDSLDRLGIDPDARHWVDVAVREAVANAIKHGNQQNPDKQVEVDLMMEAGTLMVRVQDQGAGFDPDELANPLEASNLFKPNGRGIFYMNSFMDAVEYSFPPSGGTVVTLRKRIEISDA
jgi:serine/threonine-protein kinase RsbW